jgi:hypothetical protein
MISTPTTASKFSERRLSLHSTQRKPTFIATTPIVVATASLATSSPAYAALPPPIPRPRPISNSYWATPLLLACEYPWAPYTSSPKLDALLSAGVRTFIDLTEPGELSPYQPQLSARAALLSIEPSSLEYHRFSIPDRCLPRSVEYMCAILDVLRDNEARGRISVVHCRGGVGRTGTVVGCWLVQSGVVSTGMDALRFIGREWQTVEKCRRFPHSPETGPQFDFVKNYSRKRSVAS